MIPTRSHGPSGLSLLEAIIAVGIFVATMAMLGQLLDVGIRSVELADRETVGLLRCESRMEEIVAGIRPIEVSASAVNTTLPDVDDPHWRTRITAEPTAVDRLLRVSVTVEYVDDPTAGADEPADYQQSLTRLVVDPELYAPTERQEVERTESVTIGQMIGVGESGGTP